MNSWRSRIASFLLICCASLWLTVACQSNQPPAPTASSAPASPAANSAVFLNGAGATFPLFLYQRWFKEYQTLHPNVQVNYQPIGSAAGVQQILSHTIDFGASDVAMTDEEMAQVTEGVVLLPMTAGSVAVAYNLPEISTLKLSRSLLSRIFLGEISQWNDPQLAELNPDLNLPDLPIVVIYRSDGSGTTAVFTAHLNAISSAWAQQVGTGLNVNWPTGVGIKSNAGVSAQIQQAPGAIGYVEYSYAQQLGLTMAALENQAGNYRVPDLMGTIAALDSVVLPEDLRGFVPDPPAPEAYPIVTYTWILAYAHYDDSAKAEALRQVLAWCLTEGQGFSESLGYVPLPDSVAERAQQALSQIQS